MNHIQSNEPQTHEVLQDYIFRVEAFRGYGEALRSVPLTQSEAGACDQENFVEN